MVKCVVWTREDLNIDKPVNVDFYAADSICVSGNVLNIILEDECIKRIPLKDVSMIDFNLKEYKIEKIS